MCVHNCCDSRLLLRMSYATQRNSRTRPTIFAHVSLQKFLSRRVKKISKALLGLWQGTRNAVLAMS